MIQEVFNQKNHLVVTSDHWHVLHARWTKKKTGKPLYVRAIISEHDDKQSASEAARDLVASFQAEMIGREPETRDQALVRRPGFRSLKIGPRSENRRS
jgi:hypothetical protein